MAFDATRLMRSAGIASEVDLQRAREIHTRQGGSLPRICHDLGALDEGRWARVVAKALSLPTIDLSAVEVDPAARARAPDPLLQELAAFPYQLRDDGRVLVVAMAEPQDDVGRAQLRAATGCELEIGVAGYGAIEQSLARYSGGAAEAPAPPEANAKREPGAEGGGLAQGAQPIDGQPAPEVLAFTPEHARLLEALAQASARSATALRAAVDLCVERRLFTPDDLRARLGRKP